MEHPLGGLIVAVAGGRFPAADGSRRRVPPWRSGLEAIVAFTEHAVFAVEPDIPDHLLSDLGPTGSAARTTPG